MASPSSMDGMSKEAFLTVGTTLVALTGVVVAIRIRASSSTKKTLWIDDYVATIALGFLAATFGLTYVMAKSLTDPTISPLYLVHLLLAINVLAAFSMWGCKAPILFLYIRLFGVKRWLSITSYTTLAVTGLAYLIGLSVTGGSCTVRDNTLTPDFFTTCTHRGSVMGVFLGIVAVVTDLVIFVLPLPIIIKLQLSLHKKIGFCLVFMTGIFAIIASAVSLYYKWLSLTGTSADVTSAMICTVIESCIALLVGCVPSTYSYWNNFIVTTNLYSKLHSALSSMSLSRQSGSKRIPDSEDGFGSPGSTEHLNMSATPHDASQDSTIPKRSAVTNSKDIVVVPLGTLKTNQ